MAQFMDISCEVGQNICPLVGQASYKILIYTFRFIAFLNPSVAFLIFSLLLLCKKKEILIFLVRILDFRISIQSFLHIFLSSIIKCLYILYALVELIYYQETVPFLVSFVLRSTQSDVDAATPFALATELEQYCLSSFFKQLKLFFKYSKCIHLFVVESFENIMQLFYRSIYTVFI